MNLRQGAALLLVSLSFVACSTDNHDHLAEDYRRRSPLSEAASDFASRDVSIYSAMGYGRYLPGLDQQVGRRIAVK
jgi:hypothetical protein